MKNKFFCKSIWTLVLLLPVVQFSAYAEALAIGQSNAAGEYRPDLSPGSKDFVLDAKGNFTLRNATWVIYDEDMDVLNARTDVNQFIIAASATLIFDNATKGTIKDQLFWSSAGTFIKRGSSTMHWSSKNYRWAKSKIYIQEGTWVQDTDYTIAAQNTNDVYIASGATLWLNHNSTFSGARIHASGTGVGGNGAIVIDNFNEAAITSLILDDDVLVTANVDGRILGGYEKTSGAAGKINPAELALNGHTLTIGGSSSCVILHNLLTTGPDRGDIVFRPRSTALEVRLVCGTSQDANLFDLSGVESVSLPDNATLSVSGKIQVPITPNLICDGNAAIVAYPDADNAAGRILTGDITIPADKTLNVCPSTETGSESGMVLNLYGEIKGEGALTFGMTEAPANGEVCLYAPDMHTGGTTVNGLGTFRIYACHEAAIPTLSDVVVNGGKIVPALSEDESGASRWSGSGLLSFYRQLGLSEIRPRVDLSSSAKGVTMSSSLVAAAFPEGVTWGALGGGDGGYTLTGPYTSSSPLNFSWTNGTLRLSGEDAIVLGNALVAGVSLSDPGRLLVDGAQVVCGTDGLSIGSREGADGTSVRKNWLGYVNITNSSFRCSCAGVSGSDIFEGTLFVGRSATGVFVIDEGSSVSNRIIVGGGTATSKGGGQGAVFQRGGSVVACGGEELAYSSAIGGAGEGYYGLSKGDFRTFGPFGVGNYGHGTFVQNGGLASFGGALQIAYANGGMAHYAVLGGTTEGHSTITITSGSSGDGYLTVAGADAHFDCTEAMYNRISLNAKEGSPLRTVINLNDRGVLTTTGFCAFRASTAVNPFIINFNGGAVRHCGANKNIFGHKDTVVYPKVVVYEKGVVIDSAGQDISTEGAPLEAGKTGGIQSIVLVEPQENCFVPPEIVIEGDGYGASALPLVDQKTFVLTNILVTSHGWGYTAAGTTVKLRRAKGSAYYEFSAQDVEIGPNDVGGFTKKGDGTLTLMNANAWEKWTKVEGGTLLVGVERAIPDGTALTLANGATIDLNSFTEPTFASLDGSGGTVLHGAVKVMGAQTLSAKRYINRESCAINGTLDLTGVPAIMLSDTDLLTEEAKALGGLNLYSASEILLPLGGLQIENVPAGWKVSVSQGRIRLGPANGVVLIVR